MAAHTGELMENHFRPASRETRRRAVVEGSQAACLPMPLRAKGAQSGVKGYYPLREPRGLLPNGGLFNSTDRETTPNRRAVAPVVPRR